MIYFSVGLPGALAEWSDAVLVRLIKLGGDSVGAAIFPGELLPSGTVMPVLDQAALILMRTGDSHLVMGVREPVERLRALLAETSVRFVLVLDDPRAAVTAYAGGQPFAGIVRTIAGRCAEMMDYLDLPGGMHLSPAMAKRDPCGAIRMMAHHFGIAVDEATTQQIAGAVAEISLSPDRGLPRPEEDRKTADGALAGYASLFAGGELEDLVWTRELFLLASDAKKSPSGPIDLRDTANGLFLLYGPYINLPPGSWSAKIVVGMSQEAIGQTLIVDVASTRQLAVTRFTTSNAGVFTVDLNFSADATSARNLEFRIAIGRDRAPGQMAFGHVLLHPAALMHRSRVGDNPPDFHAALQL